MKVKQLSDSQGLSYLHLVMLSLYAILLGVLVGLIDAVFGRVLIGLSEFRDHHLFYPVSYTHLDVYKRQTCYFLFS